MNAEPLWRGPTRDIHPGPANLSDIDISIKVPPGTEVEVWRAGDRTSPTRDFHATYDSVARILYEVIPNDVKTGLLDEAAMKVTRLLHGQGDETDGD